MMADYLVAIEPSYPQLFTNGARQEQKWLQRNRRELWRHTWV